MAEDVISAQLTARVRGARVEVLKARSEVESTFVNPDGSFSTEQFGAPVRVRDKAGKDGWRDVDLTLTEFSDGTVGPKVHPQGLRLAGKTSGEGMLASLADREGRGVELRWGQALPKPQLSGTEATYPNISAGTDLVQEVTRTGVEQFLLLKDRTAADAAAAAAKDGKYLVRMPVRTKGLVARDRADGGLDFVDAKGRAVQTIPAPRAWDAKKDPGSGLPASEIPVGMRFEAADAKRNRGDLVLSVDASWLASPERTFPITIDPITTQAAYSDTWIQQDWTAAQAGSTELRAGYNGTAIARSLLSFNTDAYKGADVTSATLSLWEYHSWSCSARQLNVLSSNAFTTSTTWANQPTAGGVYGSVNVAKGFSSSCADGWISVSVTSLVDAWTATGGVRALQLRAASESDVYGWKRFNSANAASNVPKLSVTYNRYPNTPGTATHSPGTSSSTSTAGWSTSATPTLKAVVSDPDGGTVKGLFSVYLNGTGTPVIDKAAGSSVTSGGTSQYVVPAGKLTNGSRYVVRVYGNDGSLTSKAWSNYDNFVVDTTAPAVPGVGSSTSPENQWSDIVDAAGKLAFTATSSASDTAKVQYSLDTATYASSVTASANQAVAISLAKPAEGKHTLYVRSMDKAGNVSAGKAYVFYVGSGVAIGQPVENHVTARRVPLQLLIDSSQVSALGTHKFQYRRGVTAAWTDIPLADVTDTAGATRSSWPATASPTTAMSYWDAATTLAGGGVVEIRALFANGSSTDPNTVTVDVNAGQAGDATAGPGSVNLLTGALSLSDTDATLFGASIGRTYGSRSLTAGTDNGQAGGFGAEWSLSGASEYTDTNWVAVLKTSATSLEVQDEEGEVIAYTAGPNGTWVPEPGFADLTLTGSFTGSFTLKDSDGNVTTFAKPTGGTPPADTWPVASSTPTGQGATARYGYTLDPAGKLRLSRVAAPNPALTDTALQACANPATDLTQAASRGCRTLELTWGVPDSGGYTGQRITKITAYTWDPAAASGAGAMTGTVEATYGYDSTGRLITATDPKPGLTTGGKALTTTYGYDSNNLLTTLTPPGEQPWTFDYATGSVVAGPAWDRTLPTSKGRLVKVSRPTLAPGTTSTVNGTATTAIVYGVPTTTAARGPVNVDAAAAATWAQSVAAVEGTAVFDADAAAQPSNDYWAGDDETTRSWGKAAVTYMDVNGREVNQLTRDGLLDATVYDVLGNEVLSIDGGNRALALGQGTDAGAKLAELGLDGLSTDARAQALATVTAYEKSPTTGASRTLWTQGPLRTVVTSTGAEAQHRPTTRSTYDAGRPTDAATSDLVTSTVTGGLGLEDDPATTVLDNARSTTTSYDWALGLPLAVTTDPSSAAGDEITVRTKYDAKGRITHQQQPSDAAGTGAGTRTTSYWDDNTGACTGRPEWGDLPCQVGYAGAITGSSSNTSLPVTTTEYNRVGAAAVVTETANGASRKTTTVFDEADRATTVTTSSSGLGANPAAQTLSYDPDTGALDSTSGGGKTISTITDTLGRNMAYTDASGLKSVTEYDSLGRPVKVTESDVLAGGLTRSFATTTAYDAATGRQTSQTDAQGGQVTLGYDTAGNTTSQTMGAAAAGGLKATSRYDTSGAEVERVWTMTGLADPVLSELAVENIHGQQVDHTMMPGGHRTYRYDGTGRLTSTVQLDGDQCTVRAYRFDANSNRTGFSSTTAAATADGNGDLTVCAAPSTPAGTATFDSGDRLTSSGYTYDAFGRTTRLPLSDGQVARVSYHSNDLVATQTSYATAADADANNGAGQNPTASSTYTLDVTGQRIATRTAQEADPDTGALITRTKTLRYASTADAPDWTDEGDGTITRNIVGPTGDLAATATIDKTGAAADALAWQISDLHGDIAATLPATDTEPLQVSRPDEYGVTTSDSSPRYGWLGAKQRAGDTPGGLLLMGVRLYNPNTGRFLSTDPVYGGNANTYTYPNDPINAFDLDGRAMIHRDGGGGAGGGGGAAMALGMLSAKAIGKLLSKWKAKGVKGKKLKSGGRQYAMPKKGIRVALGHFNNLTQGRKITYMANGSRKAKLKDGTWVTLNPNSRTGPPTIYVNRGGKTDKFRF
ncbi:RHS repeat-associated core domain-containing protein [Knoellia remsis]|uniref:RHS repeat-associated core domain-containing protein n=1 Tax=Knoellia remsis TaxID=407159 RepID=UPI000D0766BB|nr:RHS repeat-associated core domain-containing protein [Knoellia remsis]